ncbi:MAG: hypothetical protein ACR2KJ_02960 [Jatrophihabitans sp.]
MAVALAASAVIALGIVVGGAVRADPAAAAGCRAPSVAVVVDFGSLGGGIQEGCVSSGGTGLEVLSARFAVTLVHNQAFVCGINGKPSSQPCPRVPPNEMSWSYWHASPGARGWSYSSAGAGTYRPAPGSAEGWAYGGSGHAPRIAPAEALPGPAAPRTTPRPTSPRPTSPRPTSRHSTTSVRQPSNTSASTQRTTRSSPSTGSAAGRTSTFPVSPGMGVPVTEVSRPPSAAKAKGGSPLSTVLAIGVLVLLGGGGWFILRSRRRRRQSEDNGIS